MMHGLTKIEVAISQLRLSIALFMEEREHISVITLAGAAEEILGKIAALAGSTPALHRRAEGARQLHVALWGNDPGDKVFKDLKNKTRNELKHLSTGAPLTIRLEQECIRMLDRAVENYRLLHKRAAIFVVQYERRREVLRRTRDQRTVPQAQGDNDNQRPTPTKQGRRATKTA